MIIELQESFEHSAQVIGGVEMDMKKLSTIQLYSSRFLLCVSSLALLTSVADAQTISTSTMSPLSITASNSSVTVTSSGSVPGIDLSNGFAGGAPTTVSVTNAGVIAGGGLSGGAAIQLGPGNSGITITNAVGAEIRWNGPYNDAQTIAIDGAASSVIINNGGLISISTGLGAGCGLDYCGISKSAGGAISVSEGSKNVTISNAATGVIENTTTGNSGADSPSAITIQSSNATT